MSAIAFNAFRSLIIEKAVIDLSVIAQGFIQG